MSISLLETAICIQERQFETIASFCFSENIIFYFVALLQILHEFFFKKAIFERSV